MKEKKEKKVFGLFKEFKAFVTKGNVIDMAVGVIIGGAFGKIVTSIVNDLIMPLISLATGGGGVDGLKWVVKEAYGDVAETAIMYGHFLQTIIDFLIIAGCIFMFVKIVSSIGKARRKKIAETPVEAVPPAPTNEELLLTEIRDLLREQKDEK